MDSYMIKGIHDDKRTVEYTRVDKVIDMGCQPKMWVQITVCEAAPRGCANDAGADLRVSDARKYAKAILQICNEIEGIAQ